MGIQGLLPFLQVASKKCYINEFRGCTVAIDSYCWLHKGVFACADKIVRGENTNIYIQYCFKYLDLLLSYGIKPILVFDGQHLPAKKVTELKRRELRETARTRGNELLRLGKAQEALQYFRQCVDITHEMALALIKECRSRNIDCIVAPFEADAQLAYLNLQGIADLVITEDSDLVMFGCNKILFKFGLDGSGILVEREKLCIAMKMKLDDYTFDKFRNMCIMSGCDYLDSLPGIGLKRAHKAISMTADPDVYKLLKRLPSYLNLRNLTVSEDYLESFRLADATIKYQVVYDPIKRSLTRLTNPESSGINKEYLRNAGHMCDDDLAFQMALGNVDPFSKKVMDNWNPDMALSNSTNSTSIWSNNYKKSNFTTAFHEATKINLKGSKNKIINTLPENTNAIQEQYDNQLSEELKMYQAVEPPTKKQKCNNEMTTPSVSSELNLNESDIELTSNNPFIKNKNIKRLSKFKLTEMESNDCVRSRFFVSKSKDESIKFEDSNVNSEVDKNIVENEKEILNTTCSEEVHITTEEITTVSEPSMANINLQAFAFKKSPKKIDLEDYSKKGKQYSFDKENTSDEEQSNGRSSPILSLYSHSTNNKQSSWSRQKNAYSANSNLELFKFNKCKKKISKKEAQNCNVDAEDGKSCLETAITKIHISSEDFEIMERESDIENLTPEENKDVPDFHDTHKMHNQIIKSSVEICEDNISNTEFALLKPKAFSQEVSTAPPVKEKLRISNSCRSVGLSRNSKKPNLQHQPTLFTMFKKMSSKD